MALTLTTITVPTATAQVKLELQGIPEGITALGPLDVPAPLLYYMQPVAPPIAQAVVAEGFILGNDQIALSGITGLTYYLVTVFDPIEDDTIYSEAFYFISGNILDLDTAAQLSEGTIPTPPIAASEEYVNDAVATALASAEAYTDSHVVIPGGSTGQLEWNNSGAFAGVSGSSVSGSDVSLTGDLTITGTLWSLTQLGFHKTYTDNQMLIGAPIFTTYHFPIPEYILQIGYTGGSNYFGFAIGTTGGTSTIECDQQGDTWIINNATVQRNFKVEGTLNLGAVQIYANNAEAITDGHVAGDIYRTGADPDVLCIVH